MTIFTCAESLEAMMTCIYTAWDSGLGHRNIRLALEPVYQQELFCDYVHVAPDPEKAGKVLTSILKKISYEAYCWVLGAAMHFDPERLDMLYRFLLLGFYYGRGVTDMLSNACVVRVMELKRKTDNEAAFFLEKLRFSRADGNVYVSHIEPKCNVLDRVAAHFGERMPSEYWLIIDDGRRSAAVHPKDEPFYLTGLSESEFARLLQTEEQEDIFTDLWRTFFHAVSIRQREHPRCQRTHLPLWTRKHMPEFAERAPGAS